MLGTRWHGVLELLLLLHLLHLLHLLPLRYAVEQVLRCYSVNDPIIAWSMREDVDPDQFILAAYFATTAVIPPAVRWKISKTKRILPRWVPARARVTEFECALLEYVPVSVHFFPAVTPGLRTQQQTKKKVRRCLLRRRLYGIPLHWLKRFSKRQGSLTPLQLETRFWGQNYLDLVLGGVRGL